MSAKILRRILRRRRIIIFNYLGFLHTSAPVVRILNKSHARIQEMQFSLFQLRVSARAPLRLRTLSTVWSQLPPRAPLSRDYSPAALRIPLQPRPKPAITHKRVTHSCDLCPSLPHIFSISEWKAMIRGVHIAILLVQSIAGLSTEYSYVMWAIFLYHVSISFFL